LLLLKLEVLPLRPGVIALIKPEEPEVAVPGYTTDQIDSYLLQIRAAGFIDDANMRPMHGIGLRSLTWEGYDFLDSVRDPVIWSRTKKGAIEAGGFTFDLLKDLAKGFLKKQIEERTGVAL
jgi:hypothetical protein